MTKITDNLISTTLSNLLFDLDCVIFPEFGGIIGKYQDAQIHPVTHQMSPPSKDLRFNRYLTHSDNVLVNKLHEVTGVDQTEMQVQLSSYIDNFKTRLNDGESIVFPKVGSFKNNIEGKLVFTQDHSVNYLKEAFGLKDISFKPIVRSKVAPVVAAAPPVVAITQEKSNQPAGNSVQAANSTKTTIDYGAFPPPPKRKRRKKFVYASLVCLLLIALLASWMFVPEKKRLIHVSEANIFKTIFSNGETKPEISNSIPSKDNGLYVASSEDARSDFSIDHPIIEIVEKDVEKQLETKPDKPVKASPSPPKTSKPSKSTTTSNSVKSGYYVIVGSFQNQKYADRLFEKLKAQNLEAVKSQGPGSFNRVGFYVTGNKDSALSKLNAQRDVQQDAWLVKL